MTVYNFLHCTELRYVVILVLVGAMHQPVPEEGLLAPFFLVYSKSSVIHVYRIITVFVIS